MNIVQCPVGHFYDAAENSSCPNCKENAGNDIQLIVCPECLLTYDILTNSVCPNCGDKPGLVFCKECGTAFDAEKDRRCHYCEMNKFTYKSADKFAVCSKCGCFYDNEEHISCPRCAGEKELGWSSFVKHRDGCMYSDVSSAALLDNNIAQCCNCGYFIAVNRDEDITTITCPNCRERGCFSYHYNDPVTFSDEYNAAIKEVKKILEEEYPKDRPFVLGECHYVWEREKELLYELYNICCRTIGEMNPHEFYD